MHYIPCICTLIVALVRRRRWLSLKILVVKCHYFRIMRPIYRPDMRHIPVTFSHTSTFGRLRLKIIIRIVYIMPHTRHTDALPHVETRRRHGDTVPITYCPILVHSLLGLLVVYLRLLTNHHRVLRHRYCSFLSFDNSQSRRLR